MPNHVSHKFIATGSNEDIKNLFDVFQEDSRVTFKKLIPMPDDLAIDSSSSGDAAVEILVANRFHSISNINYGHFTEKCKDVGLNNAGELREYLENHPEFEKVLHIEMELGKKYLQNIVNHNARTWYEWCPRHWGTKWDAYDSAITMTEGKICAEFQTAWSVPKPVIDEIAKRFPNVALDIKFCDEGLNFTGIYLSSAGFLYHESEEESKSFAKNEFGWTFDEDDE